MALEIGALARWRGAFLIFLMLALFFGAEVGFDVGGNDDNEGAATWATIRPFCGIHYAHRPDLEISRLIAPPYDVLKDADKTALQAKHPNNIVTIDLPHMPPESLGPDTVYE